jgi:hypothetical protein
MGLFIWAKIFYTKREKSQPNANPQAIPAQRFQRPRGVKLFQKSPLVLHHLHQISPPSTILHQILHQLIEKI